MLDDAGGHRNLCGALPEREHLGRRLALMAEDEPVLFLPQPPPDTVASRLAESNSRLRLEIDPGSGSTRRNRNGQRPHEPGLRCRFVSGVPRRGEAVYFLELVLAWGVAGTFGLLLALVWTAGFVPSFLEPSAASVLLAKPVARWQLLMGKYFGVLTFVGFQVVLFVVLTWVGLGMRTNVWNMTYWWCIPLLLLQFAIFYSFSVLLAVITRSTVACVFGSVLFWLLAWGINYGYVMARGVLETALPSFRHAGIGRSRVLDLPQTDRRGSDPFQHPGRAWRFRKPTVFRLLESGSSFSPCASIASSLVFLGMLLAISVHEFNATDY